MNRETIATIGISIIIISALVVAQHTLKDQIIQLNKTLESYQQDIQTLKQHQSELREAIESIEPIIEIQNDIHIPEEAMRRTKIASADIDNLLARIVHAEAKGESYEGKVAVANVVLNRVDSPKWPDTIREVVYQQGQFQPVSNGTINNQPSRDSIRASHEAISNRTNDGAIYFYNPEIASSEWIFTRQTVKTIGNHRFAR